MRRYPQPDPETAPIIAIHCFGCGRKLGVTHEEKTYVHCTELCWHQEQLPSLEFAARDRLIRFVAEQNVSVQEIAKMFNITRPRTYQILADSNYDGDYRQSFRREHYRRGPD